MDGKAQKALGDTDWRQKAQPKETDYRERPHFEFFVVTEEEGALVL